MSAFNAAWHLAQLYTVHSLCIALLLHCRHWPSSTSSPTTWMRLYSGGDLIVLGDFKFHVDDTSDADATKFIDMIESYNIAQHVSIYPQEGCLKRRFKNTLVHYSIELILCSFKKFVYCTGLFFFSLHCNICRPTVKRLWAGTLKRALYQMYIYHIISYYIISYHYQIQKWGGFMHCHCPGQTCECTCFLHFLSLEKFYIGYSWPGSDSTSPAIPAVVLSPTVPSGPPFTTPSIDPHTSATTSVWSFIRILNASLHGWPARLLHTNG